MSLHICMALVPSLRSSATRVSSRSTGSHCGCYLSSALLLANVPPVAPRIWPRFPLSKKRSPRFPIRADLESISPNTFVDGPTICVTPSTDVWHYVFDRAGGDCPAGCTTHEYHHFSTTRA